MRFEIDIQYPFEEMEKSRTRMELRPKYHYLDRVPVNYCIVTRFFAPIFGVRYIDVFKDAETQYDLLLKFAKYQIENIPSDYCLEPVIYVHPYFDNAIPPSAQGAEVGWTDDHPIRAISTIHSVESMEAFEIARPDAGLRGTAIAWWHTMRELNKETRVSFNGIPGRADVAALFLGGLSPHMLAVDLVGEDFYWWMKAYPDECHRFLQKITLGEIAAEDLSRKIDPRPRGNVYGLAEDSAQIMSPDMYRQFCVPYANQIFDRFAPGGRGIHMCGDSTHLLSTLKQDSKMTQFEIFGYLVDPWEAAGQLGGSSLLWGNINPMLMKDGSYEEVKQAARICLEAMAPTGGLMLGDGANVCPGTPLESFQAIMDAAVEYGVKESIWNG